MNLAMYVLSILLAVGFISCSQENRTDAKKNTHESGVINIVATTGMIADIAQQVGGSHVKVKGLMGPGVDPHLYKASAGDVDLLSGADLIFYNGLHLEGKMTEIFEQMKKRGIDTVAVTDGIDRSILFKPPQFEGNYDPHVWFDVTMWMTAVGTVRDTLVSIDPVNAEDYKENAGKYLSELASLNEYVKSKAALLPEDKRVLITAHDAFNYFGRQYGFEVRGLQGISTVSEAGTQDVQNLAAFIVEREIPAIFVESSVPPKFIEAVQAAVESRGFDVKVGGSLYSDAMGNPGTPDGTYIGMIRHNIDTIVGALLNGGQS